MVATFFARSEGQITSHLSTPKYSIKAGDSWLFLEEDDTVKLVAKPEILINNIKFHPLFNTISTMSEESPLYISASDSIIIAVPYPFDGKIYYIISRLIRKNVNKGDIWIDSTIVKPESIRYKVITKVNSINVQESVPAGTFNTTLIKQEYFFIHKGETPPEGNKIWEVEFYINENPIFVRIKSEYEDLKLIKYTRRQ